MKEDLIKPSSRRIPPRYVCNNDQLCDGLYSNSPPVSFNNATCRRHTDFPLTFNFALGRGIWNSIYVVPLYQQLYRCNKVVPNDSEFCSRSTVYRCFNFTKCISKHRLYDSLEDCDYGDDEQCLSMNNTCLGYASKKRLKCTTRDIFVPSTLIGDGYCNCFYDQHRLCNDEYPDEHYLTKHISFPTICDDFWICLNTADEVDCDSSSALFKCPQHHHICASPITYKFICLPLEKANDGIIDCVGATDEPKQCRAINHQLTDVTFNCINHMNESCVSLIFLCFTDECEGGIDAHVCNYFRNRTFLQPFCNQKYESIRSDVENFLCQHLNDIDKPQMVQFSLDKTRPTQSNKTPT